MSNTTENSSSVIDLAAPYDARAVSNYLISQHRASGEIITQLRLYKLLYFSHGWYLAEFNRPLVWNSFEAWERGPVVKAVRDCFKKFGDRAITQFASSFDFRVGKELEFSSELGASDAEFIDAVVAAYQRYSAYELSELTHESGGPWEKIWNARAPVGRFGLRLKDHEIRDDFQDVAVPLRNL